MLVTERIFCYDWHNRIICEQRLVYMVCIACCDMDLAVEGLRPLDRRAKIRQVVVHRSFGSKHACNSRNYLYLFHLKEKKPRGETVTSEVDLN